MKGECQECGGGWTAAEGHIVTTCLFCGSSNIIQWTPEQEREFD